MLVFYCNREYASHAAHLVYETADGRRIGFQMHNMMGFPGKKIEANVGNVRLANTVSWNLGSDSFVPLRVEGNYAANDSFENIIRVCIRLSYNPLTPTVVHHLVVGVSNNVLLDKDGLYYADGRLKFLLEAGGNGKIGSKKKVIVDDSAVKGTWAYKMKLKRMRRDGSKTS